MGSLLVLSSTSVFVVYRSCRLGEQGILPTLHSAEAIIMPCKDDFILKIECTQRSKSKMVCRRAITAIEPVERTPIITAKTIQTHPGINMIIDSSVSKRD